MPTGGADIALAAGVAGAADAGVAAGAAVAADAGIAAGAGALADAGIAAGAGELAGGAGSILADGSLETAIGGLTEGDALISSADGVSITGPFGDPGLIAGQNLTAASPAATSSGGLSGLFGLSPSDLLTLQAGGSLLSGLTGAATNLTAGNKIQGAGNAAAGNQTAAGQRAVSDLLRIANTTRQDLLPFQALGLNAASQLAPLVGINAGGNPLTAPLTKPFTGADLENTPGYQFTKTQGLQAVQNSAAAQGLGTSGAALKGAASFATGLAQTTYNDQLTNYLRQNRQIFDILNALTSGGQNAATATGQIGTSGTAAAGQLGVGATNQAGSFSVGGAQGGASGLLGASNALGAGINGATSALTLPSYLNLVKSLSPSNAANTNNSLMSDAG